LTTNRVGAFDEAFRSRIHLSLYYPPLDEEPTMKVWKLNIKRTNDCKAKTIRVKHTEILEYAREHFNLSADGRWNGRQIRNAFQIAIALAEYDTQNKKSASKKDAKYESQDGAEKSSRTIVVRKHHFGGVRQIPPRSVWRQSTSQQAFEANHRHVINPQGNPFVRGTTASHYYRIPYTPNLNPSRPSRSS
jgi:SpoVK/Ycf46/Vps4 family AAA+-type ATPase